MNIPDEVFTAIISFSIPALGGWVWKMQQTVTKHDQILEKLDQLVDILLKDRLNN